MVFVSCRGCYATAMVSNAGNPSSSASKGIEMSQVPLFHGDDETLYNSFLLNSGGEENTSDSTGEMDEEENSSSKTEDLEVRMDLSDDLLHMVSFFF